jgi:hypothetical protein
MIADLPEASADGHRIFFNGLLNKETRQQSPPGSSRRPGGYSPVLRLTADEMRLPLFPCPKKFTFWDTTLLPRGTFWVRSAPGPLADAPRPVFLLLACCTQEEDALATSMEGRAGVCTCHSKLR